MKSRSDLAVFTNRELTTVHEAQHGSQVCLRKGCMNCTVQQGRDIKAGLLELHGTRDTTTPEELKRDVNWHWRVAVARGEAMRLTGYKRTELSSRFLR